MITSFEVITILQ